MNDNEYAKTGRVMFIVAWLVFFALLLLFFKFYGGKEQESEVTIRHGTITVTPDANGHYQINGAINNQPVHFIVDTGASLVAVPEQLAAKLNLKGRYPISLHTANGKITGSLTRINRLNFAQFTLQDIKAVIIPGNEDQPVLLGMNVLSEFKMSQEDKRLVIKK